MAFSLLGLRLSPAQIEAFARYEAALIEWNARINLTAIDDPYKIRTKHFLDSLTCLPALGAPPAGLRGRLVDVGSGAGFPGLALKIAAPGLQVTLVESVEKKAAFCRHIAATLGLGGVEVLTERAEALGLNPAYRQRFDWAVGRAVAPMPVLAEYLLPLARVGGMMIAMKGENAPAETQAAEKAFTVLGGRLRRLQPVTLPGVAEERYLVIVDKVHATPPGYPRRVGLPAKRPIG